MIAYSGEVDRVDVEATSTDGTTITSYYFIPVEGYTKTLTIPQYRVNIRKIVQLWAQSRPVEMWRR